MTVEETIKILKEMDVEEQIKILKKMDRDEIMNIGDNVEYKIEATQNEIKDEEIKIEKMMNLNDAYSKCANELNKYCEQTKNKKAFTLATKELEISLLYAFDCIANNK